MPDSKTGEPELEAIRARVEAATPGEWFTESDGIYNASRSYLVTPTGDSDQDRADAGFIAHARSDVPALLELVAALSTENERLRGIERAAQAMVAESPPGRMEDGLPVWPEYDALAAALTSPDPEGEA